MKPKLDITTYTKINSKQTTDFNVKCKTINILEQITVKNIHDLGLSKECLNRTPNLNLQKKKN